MMKELTGIDKELAALKAVIDFHSASNVWLDYMKHEDFEPSDKFNEGIQFLLEASVEIHSIPIYFKEERDRWRRNAIAWAIGFLGLGLYSIFFM